MLRTCRQIHDEAALQPLQHNTFAFYGNHCFYAFLRCLLPARQRAMKSIVVNGSTCL